MNELTRRDFMRSAAVGAALASASPLLTHAAEPKLPTRKLGKTGVDVPILGFGAGSAFIGGKNKDMSDEDAQELAVQILEAGVTYWDTAAAYGNGESERRLGLALKDPAVRKRVTLATKSNKRDYDGCMREAERSLKLLQTDSIDLFQIHNLPAAKKGMDQVATASNADRGAIKAIRKLQGEGVIKHVGVTGHSSADVLMEAIRRVEPDTILSIFTANGKQGGYNDRLLPFARERGMGVIAMKVMKFGRRAKLPPDELLRFTLSLDGVSVAIVGTDSVETLARNVATVKGFKPMPEERMGRIDERVKLALSGEPMEFQMPGYEDGRVL